MNTWQKRVTTFAIFLAWVTKGLYLEALGPAMIDLKLIYQTNYESVTRAVSGRGAGGFIGAVLGAFLVDKFEYHHELLMALFTTLAGICVAMVTNVPTIGHVWLLYCLIGGSSNIVNMAGMKIALKFWKKDSATILLLLHMGYGVGALTGPLLCTPFLAVLEQKTTDDNDKPQYTIIRESRAHVAFAVIGLITFCVAVPFYYFHCVKGRRTDKLKDDYSESDPVLSIPAIQHKSYISVINPASYADGNFNFGFSVFIFLAVYFFNLLGGEKSFGSFVRTMGVDVFKLEKTSASYLNSTFWLSLTLSRLLGSIISRRLAVHTHLLVQVVLHLGSVTVIYMAAFSSVRMFWLLTITEGFMVAPLYPLGVAFAASQINLSGFCLMIVTFTGSVGDMVFLWASGRLYDVYGPRAVLALVNLAGLGMATAVILFQLGLRKCSKNIRSN